MAKCYHVERRLKSATTDNDDVQTRTQMWLRCCQLDILANTAVGEVHAGGIAFPQSHFTSMENILNKVNSYSTM